MTDDLIQQPIYDAVTKCTACAIRKEAKRPLPPEGPRQSTVLIVGQNPGHDEERAGRIFIGPSGEELNLWLRAMGVDRRAVAITNIVLCHTEKNRAPRVTETRFCAEQWLPQTLALLPNLRVILPLGRAAHSAVLPKIGVPLLDMAAHKVRHETAAGVRDFTVYPLVHPAYILRMPGERKRQLAVLAQVRDHWAREDPESYHAVRI